MLKRYWPGGDRAAIPMLRASSPAEAALILPGPTGLRIINGKGRSGPGLPRRRPPGS